MDLVIPAAIVNDRCSDPRVRHRANYPTAEERTAGIDDPVAQARQILRESDLRAIGAAPAFIEHRTSDQTVAPV